VAQQAGQLSPDGKWLWNGAEWIPHTPVAAAPVAATWARPYESARFRATFVTVLLLANVAALVIGIFFDAVLFASRAGTSTLSDTQSVAIGLLALAYLITFYGTFISCIVLFCMWLHRVVRNMPALGALDARWSPAGAVGRCFIPILNLAHPMSGTLEAWRSSDPTQRWPNVVSRKGMRPPAQIIGWWAAWLIGGLLSRVAFQLGRSNDAGEVAASALVDLAGAVLLIAAALLAVLVVRDVTARQDRKNALITAGQLA
jgi:Domain of unknown function (DUF4328)